jgi:hypothetical protein
MKVKPDGDLEFVAVKDENGRYVLSKNLEQVSFSSKCGVPNNKQFVVNEDNYVAKKELTYSGGFYMVFKYWCIICYLDKKPK